MTYQFQHNMLPLNQLSRRLRPGEREKYLLSQEEKAAREAIVNNETDRSLGDLLRSAPHTTIPLTLLELEERDQIESEWGSPFDVVQAVPEHKKRPSISTEFPYDLHEGKPSQEKTSLNQILSDERFERALLKKDRSNEFEKFDKEYDQKSLLSFSSEKFLPFKLEPRTTDLGEGEQFFPFALRPRETEINEREEFVPFGLYSKQPTRFYEFADDNNQERLRKERQDLDAEESSAREAIEDEWDSLPFNTMGKFKELMN